MASRIITKKGSGAPLASDLVHGELAVDTVNKRLYTEDAGGTVIEVGTNPTSITTGNFGASGTIDLTGATVSNAGSITTADINGGTIDGTVIGGTTPAAVTTSSLVATTADINAGTIDNTVIGGSSEAAGTFTTLTASGDVNFDSGTLFVDASANNVGIGTSSPNAKIDARGTVSLGSSSSNSAVISRAITPSGSQGLVLSGGTNTSETTGALTFDDTASSGAIIVVGGNASDAFGGNISLNAYGTGASGNAITFKNRSALNTVTERMRIDSSGNVGIGTSSPNYPLDVDAEAPAADDSFKNVFFAGMSGAGGLSGEAFRTSDNNDRKFALQAYKQNSANAGTNYGDLLLNKDGGSVGIGTSSPLSVLTALSGSSADETILTIGNDYSVADTAGDAAGVMFQLYRSYSPSVNDAAFIKAVKEQAWDESGDRDSALVFGTRDGSVEPVERMRIDSSGNLLVGKTTTDANTDGVMLVPDGYILATQTSGTSGYFNRTGTDGEIVALRKNNTTVGSIGTLNTDLYVGSGDCNLRFRAGQNEMIPATTAGSASDGLLDLGADNARFKNFYLSGGVQHLIASGANDGSVVNDGTNDIIAVGTGGFAANGGSASDAGIRATANLVFATGSGAPERMRIDSSGNVLFGCTSIPSASVGGSCFIESSNGRNSLYLSTLSTGNQGLVYFYNPNGLVGNIVTSGSSTSYVTSSDQRLKENITDANDAGDKIDAIKVRQYDWKADGSHQDYGMVAQELMTVAPEAVSGDPESDDMMGVDYSKLVPMMLKEIQSLRVRVAQLEGAN